MEIVERDPIWPCKICGADQAPSCYVDEKTYEVDGCANCEYLQKGWHLQDSRCWCHPRLSYVDPKTKEEVWVHHDKQ